MNHPTLAEFRASYPTKTFLAEMLDRVSEARPVNFGEAQYAKVVCLSLLEFHRLLELASDEDSEAECERAVGRYVYHRISHLMDAKPGSDAPYELKYLADLVVDVEEYGADGTQAIKPEPSQLQDKTRKALASPSPPLAPSPDEPAPVKAGDWEGALAAIRALGWTVAVHNDYRLDGRNHTFWLFTKGKQCRQAECPVEDEALALEALRERLAALKEPERS